jgi:hypothetical protein
MRLKLAKKERQNSLDTLALLDESSQHIKARIHAIGLRESVACAQVELVSS